MTRKKISLQLSKNIVFVWMITMLVGLATMAAIVTPQLTEDAFIKSDLTLEQKALKIQNLLHQYVVQLNTFKRNLIAKHNGEYVLMRNRQVCIDMAERLVEQNKNIYGSFFIFEPNCFDNKDKMYANDKLYPSKGAFKVWVTKQGVQAISGDATLEYYQVPKKTLKTYITRPYYFKDQGKQILFVTITVPIVIDGKFNGAIGFDIDVSALNAFMDELNNRDSDLVLSIIDDLGNIVISKDAEIVGKNVGDFPIDAALRMQRIRDGEKDRFTLGDDFLFSSPIKILPHLKPWSVFVRVPKAKVYRPLIANLVTISAIVLLFIAIGLVYLSRKINKMVKPIGVLSDTAALIAGGDLTQVIDIRSNNEIGYLADIFIKMTNNLKILGFYYHFSG